MKVTPENITHLEPNQIFCFGSNLAGRHGKGAALLAKQKFGAVQGRGEGILGRTYAIPTKDYEITTRPLSKIAISVVRFIHTAEVHQDKEFLVTEIGCGLAGYSPKDMAPLFKGVPDNVSLPQSFWDVLQGLVNENKK